MKRAARICLRIWFLPFVLVMYSLLLLAANIIVICCVVFEVPPYVIKEEEEFRAYVWQSGISFFKNFLK